MGFNRLKQDVGQHGNARIPYSYTVDGYKLGQWVVTQRAHNVKGILDADRKRRLQDVPGWTWDPRGDQWEEGFRQLKRYVR
jgi:Helicase associated domain